ncbi:hypothetical protein JOD03_002548 [Chryseomicrobium aureum]|uniref:hypothetical protein n=1 Tax=Chryseomicrobium aureum TaxID=1441723 RepID=UPI00195EFFE3|nr:hypothetical protein [Chryseomicrobium aureum]MBM7707601.1 hypothetical protein [Chryseomicrobium aureum]
MKQKDQRTSLQKAIDDFWIKQHKEKKSRSFDERSLLAQQFSDEIAQSFGIYDYALKDIQIIHPATFYSPNKRMTNIYDVLADFLLEGTNITEERREEYPAYTAKQDVFQAQQRLKSELKLVDDYKEGDYKPPYTITHTELHDQYTQTPDEPDVTPQDIEDYIAHLKADVDASARMVRRMYGGDIDEIKAKIRKLKPDNIRKCAVCGSYFYASHGHQRVCNLTTKFIKRRQAQGYTFIPTQNSPCWNENNRNKTARNRVKSSI